MCKPLPIRFPSVTTSFDSFDMELRCSCSMYIFERDANFCDKCGDVCCDSCQVQCFHCGEYVCRNCAENHYECIKCHQSKMSYSRKVYLMIDGIKRPVKNGQEFIDLIEDATMLGRTITLNFEGVKYEYSYGTYFQRENSGIFDYMAFMKEVV